ncbi:tellurite resistance protein TerC [Kribbella orskensis]|uniref:Tellurite resistance protein TerC n=1 Tax=Kribbella orskensis TaxID=2512216 RepID=A0ABY2BKL8_9ACTN|nr:MULTISPECIES: TerC family protein [Kribbella]TCN40529.1 tellurite resistance protein TerC [Kribbella sp. VKM Ac-2500]TCO23149.1 tellurite resistance protein TerC [Kribbella orskensis]
MTVSPLVWILTVAAIVGLLLFDYFFHVRPAHTPRLREAAIWSSVYVGIALLFGLGMLIIGGPAMGSEYFAGYITEKALSVDNLFVFLIIMTSFRVPREDQQKVLLFGIGFSLIARTGFIFLGSALLNTFSWVFYLFGVALLLTAGNMLKPETEESHSAQNFVVRLSRRLFRTTDEFDGDRLFTVVDGRRVMTPMLLVMVAIGGTDLLFALDSIPAIFGLTQNVYIVFTATAFSLLGLRQLYFLLDGLLDRLIYLSYGLAAILAFIGAKLILHALHENNLPFVNGGEPVDVAEISTGVSLVVILGVLLVTILASLFSTRGRTQTAMAQIRRDAAAYLDSEYTADPGERERIFRRLLGARDHIIALGPRARQQVKNEPELMDLCRRAAASHAAAHPEHEIRPSL